MKEDKTPLIFIIGPISIILLIGLLFYTALKDKEELITSVKYTSHCEECEKVEVPKEYNEKLQCLKEYKITNIAYIYEREFPNGGWLSLYGNYKAHDSQIRRINGLSSVEFNYLRTERGNSAQIVDKEGGFYLVTPKESLKVSQEEYMKNLVSAVESLCEKAKEDEKIDENIKSWKKIN